MVHFRMSFVVSSAMRIKSKECNVIDVCDTVSTCCLLLHCTRTTIVFDFRVLLKQHRIMKTGSSQHLDQIAYIILASNICRGGVGELGW